jgi:flagellar hook-associated protein 3 FlgL
MRISTQQFYRTNTNILNNSQQTMLQEQMKIASGKRIESPSDDPVGAARIALLENRISRTDRYESNAEFASNVLTTHEATMKTFGDIGIRLKELQVRGGDLTLNREGRKALADEASQLLNQMVSLANSKDPNGDYIYSGNQTRIQPITQSGTTYTYNGDDGQRSVNISSGMEMPVSDSGYDLFMNLANADGNFTVTTGWDITASTDPEYPFRTAFNGVAGFPLVTTANTGTKAITSTEIYDRDLYVDNIDNYFIKFDTTGADPTYTVYDSNAQVVVTPTTFTEGDPIQFRGVQVDFDVTGSIANNDIFHISPEPRESIFATVQDMITNFERPTSSQNDYDVITEENENLLYQIDLMINHFSDAQTVIGARQNSIELSRITNTEVILSAKETIGLIGDTDIIDSVTKLNAFSVSLQAAQQTFAQVQRLTIFNFIS